MSDLFLTPAHHELRAQVRAFAQEHVAPRVEAMEATQDVEVPLARLIAEQGWLGATIETAYGGMGAGHLAKTLIIEELSRVSAAMGAMVQASQLGTAKIIHYGSDTQKRQWLPKIAAGTCLPTIAVTEPGCGSHVAGMTTTATRDGDTYLLNGGKVYVGNSHIGHLHGVIARTGDGPRGLTAFLVEHDTPGLTLPPHGRTLGLHGFSFGALRFEQCRIPAANRLGTEGQGLDVAYSSSLLYGRANLTAVALGIHQAILEATVAFCRERERYGASLARLGTVQAKIGQIHGRLITARTVAYHAASLLDHGRPCDTELINAKLQNVELALDSARTAMELHAAAGLFTDRPIERFLRDAHHILAPAGTSDIQALRLAEAALGDAKPPYSARHIHPFPTPQTSLTPQPV
ncbi:acyl-CoA dehydrogenase family protein [Streptomyces sp. NPDC001941]|uniref:acyl-CoA dehydrogenase family protein n=1 Tax=Streptomyces sp. NPDC001941 TaxID=3154659 RepID=UPI00331FE6CA